MTEERMRFLAKLAEVLEVPAIRPEDDYRTTALWGSLTCFALKVMLEQEFACMVSLRELDGCATAGELMRKVVG